MIRQNEARINQARLKFRELNFRWLSEWREYVPQKIDSASWGGISGIGVANFTNFRTLDTWTGDDIGVVEENKVEKNNFIRVLQRFLDPRLSSRDRHPGLDDFRDGLREDKTVATTEIFLDLTDFTNDERLKARLIAASLPPSFLLAEAIRKQKAMTIRDGFVDMIGKTPLIRLKGPSDQTGCAILGKAEFMNPGQSVKDRAALAIIEDAEQSGALRPGGVIVEGTAGNTGIGLALVANTRGYRTVIIIPETQSQEKKDMLRLCGAELIEVPAVPYRDPNNYVKLSGRKAQELARTEPNGAIWANQFDNVANRNGHYRTTGPEIWEQTDGKVDGFICAVGSGGTLAGVAMALRERNRNIQIGLADPMGAALFHYYKHGELKAEGSSITEGIGQGRITANLKGLEIDHPFQIPDEEALVHAFDLLEQEGLCLCGSSGVNVAGAVRLAREMGPGHTIVTILCDYGNRYQSKMFNPAFLREKGLPIPRWLD